MLIVTFLAKPAATSEDLGAAAGAYVNYWVDTNDAELAAESGRKHIEAEGWQVRSVTEVRSADAEERYEGDPAQYFREARQHGHTLVFHKWPNTAYDSEIDYEAFEDGDS